jgi:hypothetical protein
MVERFGPEIADMKFEQLFCRTASELMDSEIFSLPELLKKIKAWERMLLPFRGLSPLHAHL